LNDPQPTPPPPRNAPYRVTPAAKGPDSPASEAGSGAARAGLRADDAVTHEIRVARPSAPRLLNVGYGNLVAAARVVAIVAPAAAPMRRLRREAADRGKLVDATEGRRTRSILILDSDHVVLSAILPDTLATRILDGDAERGA
jgi:hypothetical protein